MDPALLKQKEAFKKRLEAATESQPRPKKEPQKKAASHPKPKKSSKALSRPQPQPLPKCEYNTSNSYKSIHLFLSTPPPIHTHLTIN